MSVSRAFIVRPFGVKEGINFDLVEEKLITPALTGAAFFWPKRPGSLNHLAAS